MYLNQEETVNNCKTKFLSATTVEEIISISNSFKGLINNELLKELEVGFRPYRYISCSEAELEYLKNELAKIESDTNGSDKIEIEKQIKQIEQELKGTYIREDETDIERYTRYIKALSLALDDSWERHYFYWCYYDKWGGKSSEYVDMEEEKIKKLGKISKYYEKRLEELKNK